MVPFLLNRRPVLKHLTADTPLGNVLVLVNFPTPLKVPVSLVLENAFPLLRTDVTLLF